MKRSRSFPHYIAATAVLLAVLLLFSGPAPASGFARPGPASPAPSPGAEEAPGWSVGPLPAYAWDAVCVPVRLAAGTGAAEGALGARCAFLAADGSWKTGYDYYTGAGDTPLLYTQYGILTLSGEHNWTMLGYDGAVRYHVAVDDAPSAYASATVSEGICLLSSSEGAPLRCLDLETGAFMDTSAITALGAFSGSLAPAQRADGPLWGYVDRTGAWIIPPRFVEAAAFQDGLAVVRTGADTLGVIDRRGFLLLEARCRELTLYPRADSGAWYALSGGTCEVLSDPGALEPISSGADGRNARYAPGGWLWYDETDCVRLVCGERRYTLPAGMLVERVWGDTALLRHPGADGGAARMAVRLDGGAEIVPWADPGQAGAYSALLPLGDGVSGRRYLAALRDGACDLLSSDGGVLATIEPGGDFSLQVAKALDFSREEGTGAYLVDWGGGGIPELN